MPPRARSASIASASGGTRRSSRVPPSPAPKPTPKPTPKKSAPPKKKRARSASVAIAEDDEDEEDFGEEDVKAKTGSKRKARSPSPATARTKKVVAPKPPKIKVPIPGINPLPTRYADPSAVQGLFDFEIPKIEGARTAFVFGNGDMGQHGLGTEDNVLCEIKRPRPQKWFEEAIAEKKEGWENGIADVVAGGMHTLAVDGLGRVWSWGINDNAALGRSTANVEATETTEAIESETLETQPMMVEGLQEEGFKAVRVAAGDSVSLAISELGEVRCWGSFRASEGLLGFGKDGESKTQLKPVELPNLGAHTIVQIATGDDHFLALTTKGEVFACGNGEQNQLGRKIVQRHKTAGLTPERLALRKIVLVGSGSYHSFAVDQKGHVYAWGLNSFGQSGVAEDDGGWSDIVASPTLVRALEPSEHDGARVVQIAGGVHHTVFLFSNGEVWACGRCDGHETGLGVQHPEMVANEERMQAALKERRERQTVEEEQLKKAGLEGEALMLKSAELAAQGVPLPNAHVPIPSRLTFPVEGTKIVQIASGTRHNFAVDKDGLVYAWGAGNTSQLGLGDEEEAETPTRVKSQKMEGFRVLQAATGGQHSLVVATRPAPVAVENGSA
ncbi:regulator of chromosome condensation [Pseudohyphozyma bogoriensis]|nr:regulator of chromosome condensation [Pseudohyphozyma bogoriensis]